MSKTVADFDFSVNVLASLLWQHNNAPMLTSLARAKHDWVDQANTQFWNDWFRDVFDLRTANEFGCRVWAAILGSQLFMNIGPGDRLSPTFGFGSENPDGSVGFDNGNVNYDRGNFTNLESSIIGLTVQQQRILLRLRYFQLIGRCTVPEINRILADVFADEGSAYVLDSNDMQFMVYMFLFNPSSQLAFLLENFDLLPRPATVGVRYNVVNRPVWGYGPEGLDVNTNLNYDRGNYPTELT